MSPATPVLLSNVAVIVGSVLTVWITSNPLALFGLLFLKDVPVVISSLGQSEDEESGQPMGFIH